MNARWRGGGSGACAAWGFPILAGRSAGHGGSRREAGATGATWTAARRSYLCLGGAGRLAPVVFGVGRKVPS